MENQLAVSQDIFANLNQPQRDAVQHLDGPLLVLAGAGTGKTRVLTTRIANILYQNKAFPSQILAVTFTNKASREMAERVEKTMQEIGATLNGALWLGTFHSIFLRILRRYPELIGLKPGFNIIDEDDKLRLLKNLIAENNIDDKRFPAKQLAGIIDRLKDQGIPAHRADLINNAQDYANGQLVKMYQAYQARLHALNVVDFGDLLLLPIELFNKNPQVLAEYQRKFKYILVDEYQDTNIAQYLILRLLAQEHKNICCVGDDDQSIYSWRGAEVANILKFETDFPAAKIIRLEQNYRSTKPILAAASKLISFNKGRLGKTLWTATTEDNKIKVISFFDEKSEAEFIGKEIEAQRDLYKHPLKEIAILVRAGFQTRAFEEAFLGLGLPYKIVGGLRFYERMEIRDAIAYLRLLVQDTDDLAFARIINTPKRGIGDSTIEKITNYSKQHNIPMLTAASEIATTLPAKARSAIIKFVDDFKRWRELLNSGKPYFEVAEVILKESGYEDMWKAEKTLESQGRLENLAEFITALQDYESIEQFLEHVSLVNDIDNITDQNMVNVMTLHAAKGLEFQTVFLPGWEEGVFPSQRSIDETGLKGLEEERRLAYVGITRARKNLYISFASRRRIFNQWQDSIPSRFVDELPKEQTEMVNSGINFRPQNPNLVNAFNQQKRAFVNIGDSAKVSSPKPAMSPWNGGTSKKHEIFSGAKENSKFSEKERIFHDKFGYGFIRLIEGDKITVQFDKAGIKTLLESFLKKL